MTDAPERIVCRSGLYYEYSQDWYEGEWVTKEDNETYDFEQEVEYVRADLSTYDAGFAAGIGAAVEAIERLLPEGGAAEPQDETDRLIDATRRSDVQAIRALTPSAPAPVVPKMKLRLVWDRGYDVSERDE
jgi:hypothetical protein